MELYAGDHLSRLASNLRKKAYVNLQDAFSIERLQMINYVVVH